MNAIKVVLVFIFILLPPFSLGSSLQLEGTSAKTVFNYFQIPNNINDRVSLPATTTSGYRITGFINLSKTTSLYILYAPLTIKYNFQSASAFSFNGTSFQTNRTTEVTYKFNSYRLGYLWQFNTKNSKYWIGPTMKIRDANILINQENTKQSYENIGFVPLVSIGIEYHLLKYLSLYTHIDGLAAPQGSAYDGSFEIRIHPIQKLSFTGGLRTFGGGADNKKLATFAQFNSYTASIVFKF